MQLYSTGKISIDMDEKPIVQNKTYHVPGGGDFSRFYILYVVPPVRVVYHVFFFLLLPCVLQACVFFVLCSRSGSFFALQAGAFLLPGATTRFCFLRAKGE